jgi:hypothetical protein
MSLHFACRSATHRLSGRVLKASREVIRGCRLMSEAASTSIPGGANAPVAVGKGESWESVAKDVVRNGGASFVVIAGLLVGNTIRIGLTNANMEKYAGQTNTNIEKTNLKIEKLSGETNLKMAELRHDVGTLSTKTNYLLGSVIGTAVLSLASLVSTLMVLSKK